MKLSIIIPCFNSEKYINECLNSVLKALSAEDEVICVDDGSTDSTFELLHAISDSRLKVITQKNMGPGGARNTGIDAATGDQILFVDSDDTISPSLINTVKAQPLDSLCTQQIGMRWAEDWQMMDDISCTELKNLSPSMTLSATEVRLDIMNADYASAKKIYHSRYDIWGPIVKTYCRNILETYHIRFPEKLRWGEDICFNLQYLSHIEEVSFFPVTAYWYRKNQSSLINGYYPEKNQEIQRFLKTVHTILQESEEKEREGFHFLAVKQYVYILESDFCNQNNHDSFATRKEKALTLKEENPLIRQGFQYCQGRNRNIYIGFISIMLHLKWFRAVDLIIKLYTALKK